MHSNYKKIFFKDIQCRCSIGVYDEEKAAPQRILINAEFFLKEDYLCKEDRLEACFDYDQLRTLITSTVNRGHFHLQETLCETLMDACLAYEQIIAARISTAKLDVYDDCAAVGYEIFRAKP